jgi:hypothetical protein
MVPCLSTDPSTTLLERVDNLFHRFFAEDLLWLPSKDLLDLASVERDTPLCYIIGVQEASDGCVGDWRIRLGGQGVEDFSMLLVHVINYTGQVKLQRRKSTSMISISRLYTLQVLLNVTHLCPCIDRGICKPSLDVERLTDDFQQCTSRD